MFKPANQLNFIRRVLYDLKRDYGTKIDVYQTISSVTDPRTGHKTVERRRFSIRKAILLPTILWTKFMQQVTHATANRNFPYGAEFGVGTRIFIVDGNDLPTGVVISENDYLVHDEHRYQIDKNTILEHGYAYMINTKETEGALPESIVERTLADVLFMTETVNGAI